MARAPGPGHGAPSAQSVGQPWGPALAQGASFSRTIEDRKTGRIIGGVREVGSSDYVFFDNELQAHWNAVLRAFPDERVQLQSHSDDFSRLVLKIFGPKDGYVYALYDWYSHRAIMLGPVYEGVTSAADRSAAWRPVMLSAWHRAGKSATLVTMKHEDHWLSRGETRLQMLQATVDFLKVNNPPN